MILIELIEARRNLLHRCKELFTDEKIAEQIYRFLCEGLEECENKKDTFFQGWLWNNSNTTAYNQLWVNENLISREQAIEKVNAYKVFAPTDGVEKTLNAVMEAIAHSIAELPVAEVRHGRWETIDKGHFFYDWKCSNCGGSGRADYLFCPNCGAKMDLEEE